MTEARTQVLEIKLKIATATKTCGSESPLAINQLIASVGWKRNKKMTMKIAKHVQVKWKKDGATVQDKYYINEQKVTYEEYLTAKSGEWRDVREVEIDPFAIDTRGWV